MEHHTTLVATIVAGIVLAFAFGALAHKLRLSPLVGYLIAGVAIGPFTPGFVADGALAPQLAEIGVILLMFGVGLHFSPHELMQVRAVAVPGAFGQIAVVTGLGMAAGHLMGWPLGGGIVFGLALSVASTVVVLRTLQERRLADTDTGRIAVGWLVVEDLIMVLALVALPALAGPLGGQPKAQSPSLVLTLLGIAPTLSAELALTAAKLATFALAMFFVGRRLIPWILERIAATGSRELFRLAVLAIALGTAYGASELFGVSFAIGAFFAGVVLSESDLAHDAAEETLPLRDAFAVLFFVSVGMLFDPAILLSDPVPVIATSLIVVLGNALVCFVIVRMCGIGFGPALVIAAAMAQVGEFSFVLGAIGVGYDLMPAMGRDLILAAAMISILVNPLLFMAAGALRRRVEGAANDAPKPHERMTGHAVVVGHGRVGSLVAEGLKAAGIPYVVVEERQDVVDRLHAGGVPVVAGNAAQAGVLEATDLRQARWFVSAIHNPFESGSLIEMARAGNPGVEVLARAHNEAEVEYLRSHRAGVIFTGESEIAHGIVEHIVARAPKPWDGAGTA